MWVVAAAGIILVWGGAVPNPNGVSAVPAMASGAELRLPRPGAWPCRRFDSAMVKVLDEKGAEPDPGKGEEISVEWSTGGRRFRVAGRTSPGPLSATALPRVVVLVSRRPHDHIVLTMSCNDEPDETSEIYENARFVGVSWLCTATGCLAEGGYPLPRRLARSARRLRLCSTPREPDTRHGEHCDGRHRDVRPAFVDAGAATALARDILGDVWRTTEDACRVAGGCNSWVRTLPAAVRPEGWRVTSWRVWARNEPSRGDEGMELGVAAGSHTLRLECFARPTGGVQGCWLEARDREGSRLFNYEPIDEDTVPEARLERSSGDDIVLAADPEDEIPPACSLSGAALRAR